MSIIKEKAKKILKIEKEAIIELIAKDLGTTSAKINVKFVLKNIGSVQSTSTYSNPKEWVQISEIEVEVLDNDIEPNYYYHKQGDYIKEGDEIFVILSKKKVLNESINEAKVEIFNNQYGIWEKYIGSQRVWNPTLAPFRRKL